MRKRILFLLLAVALLPIPSGTSGITSGRGTLLTIVGTDPAAGVEITETVPAGQRWRIAAFRIELVTDATVPGRVLAIFVDDGTNNFFKTTATGVQAASVTRSYSCGASVPNLSLLFGGEQVAWPSQLVLSAGDRIRTVTINLAAGDDFTAPILLVEQWPE